MDQETLYTILGILLANNGFWAFLTNYLVKRNSKSSASEKMLKGLAHDRIWSLGECYITQGYISKDDYENLHDYLYRPYKDLGGNGTAEKIMLEVNKLPLIDEVEPKALRR